MQRVVVDQDKRSKSICETCGLFTRQIYVGPFSKYVLCIFSLSTMLATLLVVS